MTFLDVLLFFILAVICFFTFEHSDILHTAGSSFGYLNGHFLDFYEYNAEFGLYDSYMPITYLTFALWNIPLRLCGIVTEPTQVVPIAVVMWYKLLPVLLYFLSGWIVYKIALEMNMGRKKAKLCAYAYLTMPIGFFSQFIFGQYDIFTLFCMLLGYYYYLKGKNKYFILFFALAIPYKYFALLLFVPLLLLKEKNIWKILKSIILVGIPYLLQYLLYYNSEVFKEYVLGFGVTGYAFAAGLDTGAATISYVIVVWLLIAAWSYFERPDQKAGVIKWSLFLVGMVGFCIFGLSQWHPQWLLLIVPFFVLSAFLNQNTKIFLIIDILWMLFFVLFTVNYWYGRVDENLILYGVLGERFGSGISYKTTMRDILILKDMDLINSAFTFLLLVSAVFKHPKFCVKEFSQKVDDCMGWIRARFLGGLAIFLVPAFLCFVTALTPPFMTFKTEKPYEHISGMINRKVSQVFLPQKGVVEKIEFMLGTFRRSNDVTLNIDVVDKETERLVYHEELNMKEYDRDTWITLETGGLCLSPKKEYRIDFSCYDATGDNCITLFRTQDRKNQKNGYVMEGGEILPYNLCIRIIETN